jgi:hypothetical protein
MFNFKIIRHDDYHGDPICFSIVDEDGYGRGRFPSEIEAIEWLPYLEALAEDEKRFPPHREVWGELVLPAAE